ncbi:MAG: cytidylate kinase-like family protein [Chthoniobacterales bacterium]|nr:cytidylate kinase-like family protein [Chthoniobacterales bacterium]
MPATDQFAKYRAYFLSQKDRPSVSGGSHPPFVTISRQAGAGAETIAQLLAEKLDARGAKDAQPWTVFDKNLIAKVLEDQDLPQAIAAHVSEDKDTTVKALVGELLGLHPSMWTIFHHTSDTVLKLARIGRCIIVGRGGNIITAKLKGGIHVRLVAPESTRLAHLKSHFGLDDKAAAKYLREHDEGRRRYVKSNFDRDIDDPLLYHAVLNTGLLGFEQTASLLAAMIAPKL